MDRNIRKTTGRKKTSRERKGGSLLPIASYYRGSAPELLWQQKLNRDRLTILVICPVQPCVCMLVCLAFCMRMFKCIFAEPVSERIYIYIFMCLCCTSMSSVCSCITVIHQQMYGVKGTCPRAGGRSQTQQKSISGTSPPAPHSTTDLLLPGASTPLPAISQTLSVTDNRNHRNPSSCPTRSEDPQI